MLTRKERDLSLQSCRLCGHKVVECLVLPHTKILKCVNRDCQLMFSYPQLDSRELDAAYRKLYYPASAGKVVVYENTPEDILRQTFHETNAKCGPLAQKSLLDYGCGVGRLAAVAREFGMRTTGIEADARAREIAGKRGALKVYANLGELRAAEPYARFEIITMWQVIEHLRDPWNELGMLSRLLEPEGYLLVATPNANSLRALLEQERWVNFANPTHFYYFTRHSLRFVLERAGFCGISEWRFPIRYPGHRAIRGIVGRALMMCRLHGGLLYVARPRMPEPVRTSHSQSAIVEATR
jgi:2-polyprenyl-3-methyl-5-hydroxy-6-metoxy-1,4-benzoquinol methylase